MTRSIAGCSRFLTLTQWGIGRRDTAGLCVAAIHQTAWAARAESRWATPLERIRYVTERKSAIAVVPAVGASVPTAVAVAVVTVPRPRDCVGSKRR